MTSGNNYQVRAQDMNYSVIFHAEQFGINDWRYTSSDITIMAIGTRQSVISALAHYVGTGKITIVDGGQASSRDPMGVIRLSVDAAGNAWWDGHSYLSSAEWLNRIVPAALPPAAPREQES